MLSVWASYFNKECSTAKSFYDCTHKWACAREHPLAFISFFTSSCHISFHHDAVDARARALSSNWQFIFISKKRKNPFHMNIFYTEWLRACGKWSAKRTRFTTYIQYKVKSSFLQIISHVYAPMEELHMHTVRRARVQKLCIKANGFEKFNVVSARFFCDYNTGIEVYLMICLFQTFKVFPSFFSSLSHGN